MAEVHRKTEDFGLLIYDADEKYTGRSKGRRLELCLFEGSGPRHAIGMARGRQSRVRDGMRLIKLLSSITSHPINRASKLRSLARFTAWQVKSRLLQGEIVINWIENSRLAVTNGDSGITGNIYSGLHEFPEMAYLLHVLRPEDIFVDVGANVGSYTILAASVVGASGYAFEPVPQTFAKLQRNIELNHLEARVVAQNLGLADKAGTLRFTSDLDAVNHAVASGEVVGNTIEIAVTTLDSALHEVSPSLVKVDVEGYETLVLKGGLKTLSDPNLHSVIVELNNSGDRYGFDEAAILTTMKEMGFGTYTYDPFIRRLTSLEGQSNFSSGNTLFIRGEAFVRNRLLGARKFVVLGLSI